MDTDTPIQKNSSEIRNRINELEARLQLVESAYEKELKKPFFKRDYYVFHFLNLERKSYERSLQELKWVINE